MLILKYTTRFKGSGVIPAFSCSTLGIKKAAELREKSNIPAGLLLAVCRLLVFALLAVFSQKKSGNKSATDEVSVQLKLTGQRKVRAVLFLQ